MASGEPRWYNEMIMQDIQESGMITPTELALAQRYYEESYERPMNKATFRGRVVITKAQILEALGITTGDVELLNLRQTGDGKYEAELEAEDAFIPTHDEHGFHLFHCNPSRRPPDAVVGTNNEGVYEQVSHMIREVMHDFEGREITEQSTRDIKRYVSAGVKHMVDAYGFLGADISVDDRFGRIRIEVHPVEGQNMVIEYALPMRRNVVVNGGFEAWNRGENFFDLRAEAEL